MPGPDFDIIIIGAGISGIAFARFYLEIHPNVRLALIEENSCIGGVWSSTRLYDEFWTQSGRRMVGFSDVAVAQPPNAPSYYGCIEAKYVTEYLEDYVDNHIYNGAALRSRVHFEHRVERVEKLNGLWNVKTRDVLNDKIQELRSSKLVVAAGLTSQPNLPRFLEDQQEFDGPIRHHKHFREISKSLLNESKCKNVIVLGAGKSATDMVYESVKKGKHISWIIRKDGEGPALFFPASGRGRYENSTEASSTRINALFSPSSFIPISWLVRLIHGTATGREYLSRKIQGGDQSCRDVAAYRDRRGALPGFKNLEPTTSAFWCTGPLGLAQHDDFWDTLAQNVHVYCNDIDSLKAHSIILDDGSEVTADVILCGTGWKSYYPFFSAELAHSLGLPHSPEGDSPEDVELWTSLLKLADQRVLANFPLLAHPPPHKKPEAPTTTARLYNCIAPLEDPSIVFLGRAHLSNSFRTAEAQAIWATAYFDGNVKMPELQQARQEVAYMNALSRRRYPSHGAAGDYLFFELVSYTDKLLDEVGITSHRKGWWADWVEPCLASDLRGVKDEYRKKYGF